MQCELHRCDQPATLIIKGEGYEIAACDYHAAMRYRAAIDPTPINSIIGSVVLGDMKLRQAGGSDNYEYWRRRIYSQLGKTIVPIEPRRADDMDIRAAWNAETEAKVQKWIGWLPAGRRS